MFLYGKNSVFERLKSNPASIKKIFLQDSFNLPDDLEKIIRAKGISVERVSFKKLNKMKRAKDLQSIVAEVDQFIYTKFADLLEISREKKLVLIFLDRVNDPHNLGVIIRTLACFGGFALVIPKFEACQVNETVLHVATGGENYLPISLVVNLANAIREAKRNGWWIMGSDLSSQAQDIRKISLPFPLGVVLGSEGEGIRYGVQKLVDIKALIPMSRARLSFNVNIACAIFCYEITRQRKRLV